MRKYHHLGIPITEKREGEVHLKHLKIYVSGYKESPYHIEWMRYEPDAPYPELVKTLPHVAFEVDATTPPAYYVKYSLGNWLRVSTSAHPTINFPNGHSLMPTERTA